MNPQAKKQSHPAAKVLNWLLAISFVVTNLVPVTGLIVHKIASVVFLLLCIVHTIVYRKRLKGKGLLLLGLVIAAFLSGLLGMIFSEVPLILALHKVISIGSVFALAIHIFLFHRRMR